ncbi:hypothetical protein [Neomoorella thermoacetica]|uniref:hypothetical protein n=1 Tax=Neomoorella thermoacetica TaxID=1525 RepID=UPI000910F634|nr:hypothetical protein [Moorella thermoacetica]OIQ12640.1 hypothetical protein MOOTH_00210 [Moorella thermoacetica]
MLAIVNSVVLVGLEGQSVRVEVDISNGLPVCEMLVKFYTRYVYLKRTIGGQ